MWGSTHKRFHMGFLLIPDSTKNNCGKAQKYCLSLLRSPSHAPSSTKKIKQFPKRALINPLTVGIVHILNHSVLSSSWIDITCKSLCLRTNAVHILNTIYLGFWDIYNSLMWLAHHGIWYFLNITGRVSVNHSTPTTNTTTNSSSRHVHIDTRTLIAIVLSSNYFYPILPSSVLLYSVV